MMVMLKKKQSIVSNWDRHEMGVAEILIQLPELIPVYDYSSFGWGAKRRRSQPKILLHPPSVAKSFNVAAGAATSPATPLMFSPSESDDKPNTTTTSSPVSLSLSKRKLHNKEELMQSLTELTHQKDSLVKEMEAVNRHLDTLRASNIVLKHRKQVQIVYGPTVPTHQTHYQYQQLNYPFQLQEHQPSILQWSAPAVPLAENKMASVGLPDLNLSLEELAADNMEGGRYDANANAVMVMDHNANTNNSRAVASAQARKRRMQICKEKNQSLRQR